MNNKPAASVAQLQALMIQSIESLENRIKVLEKGQKTLRDEFAMAAITSGVEIIARNSDEQLKVFNLYRIGAIATVCYLIADAMMAQRSKS